MDREPAEGRVQRLTVVIEGGPDSDPTELAHLTGQLRRSLLELDVEDVQLPRDAAVPPGAKASDAVAIGTLIVTLAPPVTHALIRLLQGWRKGRAVAAVKVTLGGDSLELTNASQDEMDRLTTEFIKRHAVT